MGIGVLWGRAELLDAMPPFLGGGEMILQVTKEGFTTNELPWKFEAGTPMVGEAVGLGAAIDYLEAWAWTGARARGQPHRLRHALAHRTLRRRHRSSTALRTGSPRRRAVARVPRRSPPRHRAGARQHNICVRAGNHCAKPLMKVLGVPATTRVSLYVYNDESEVDALVDALAEAGDIFGL